MAEMSTNERELSAKPFIMELQRKEWVTPFDIAKKMPGGVTRLNIDAAETMMRRMTGQLRDFTQGDTVALAWIYKNQTGKGAWLQRTVEYDRFSGRPMINR